ncbi:MAG: hypothetical protein ABIP50_03735 [Candidatus Saccharimonadales bacterium]
MTTPVHPDYREIDTPWEPQPIAWRYLSADTMPQSRIGSISRIDARANLVTQIENRHLTHIVREVDVSANLLREVEHPFATIVSSLVEVNEQFRQLEAFTSLKVASTDWHVFPDPEGRIRTLARVEIIDPAPHIYPRNSFRSTDPEREARYAALRSQLKIYRRHSVGQPLDDIDRPAQYVFGTPRSQKGSPLAHQAMYLVDIEPFLTQGGV